MFRLFIALMIASFSLSAPAHAETHVNNQGLNNVLFIEQLGKSVVNYTSPAGAQLNKTRISVKAITEEKIADVITATQNGERHDLDIKVVNLGFGVNNVTANQSGVHNTALINVSGQGNNVSLNQGGTNQFASLKVLGNSNTLIVNQR